MSGLFGLTWKKELGRWMVTGSVSGDYKGAAKIVQGTGRFENASGNLDWAGPFIVWSPDGENFYGRFNPDIRGNICGVQ